MNSLEKYKDVLEGSARLRRPPREKTIFSIGGKGHYENPVSDVLAFYLYPREEHGLRDLFLKSLFEALMASGFPYQPSCFDMVQQPTREVSTDSGNRMDLFLEAEDWVMVIENKVRSSVNNPLQDYEQYLRNKHPSKERFLVLLMPHGDKPGSAHNWWTVTYQRYLDRLQENSGPYLMDAKPNKWHVFMRDFMINLRQEATGDTQMEKRRLEFVAANYQAIYELLEMKNEYAKYLQDECTRILQSEDAVDEGNLKTRCQAWKGKVTYDPALSFYSDKWRKDTWIWFLATSDGTFHIDFSLGGLNEKERQDADSRFVGKSYPRSELQRNGSQWYGSYNTTDVNEAFEEFRRMAKEITAFFA
ncbi:MAG: PD-(D/E)XK nuclease family protein [Pseudomonadota bacterium]